MILRVLRVAKPYRQAVWLSMCAAVAVAGMFSSYCYSQTVQKSTVASPLPHLPGPQSKFQVYVPIAVQSDMNRIARALESTNADNESKTKVKYAADYLKTQKHLAHWSALMLLIAGIETIVTGIGVVLVWKTLEAARSSALEAGNAARGAARQADTATETLKEIRRNSAAELRAYLTVEPHGITKMIGENSGIGQILIRNVGKIPANRVSVVAHMRSSSDRREKDFSLRTDDPRVERTIQPGTFMRQGCENQLLSEVITSPGTFIYVFGVAYYDDGFGVRRRTGFCHRYATINYAPDTDGMIAINKARYHVYGNSAD